jgi:hypothetical protein
MESSPKIILNQIRTPDGTIIRSMHRHDYVTHKDKNGLEYMVDGGCDYLRRNFHAEAPYEELSVYDNDTFEVIRQSFHRGGRGKDGTQPLTWVPISEMSDAWLQACIDYNIDRGYDKHDGGYSNSLYEKELEYRKEQGIFIED